MTDSKGVAQDSHGYTSEGVDGLYSLLQRTIEDNREQAIIVRQVSESVKDIAKEVSNLAKVLVVGNGQPAITVRMALVERAAIEAKEELEDLKTWIETQRTALDGKRWQLVLLFGTGILSLLTAIVPHIIAGLIRHP